MKRKEQEAFEKLSRKNYKRWLLPLIDDINRYASHKPRMVLDVASGPGYLVKELSIKYPKATIYGIDLQPSAIKIAKKNNTKNKSVYFKRAAIEKLPFSDSVFDLVVCKDSFHEFSNPKQALKEMLRVAKPGGLIYIQDLRRDAPMYLLKRVIKKRNIYEILIYYSVRASYTKEEMRRLLLKLPTLSFEVKTRNLTPTIKKKYKKVGIEINQLREAFQSRYVAILTK